jgi:hypothetical protein
VPVVEPPRKAAAEVRAIAREMDETVSELEDPSPPQNVDSVCYAAGRCGAKRISKFREIASH